MIKKIFGSTIVFVCESTAHCSVHRPTDIMLNNIVDDIVKSNYVVDIILDPKGISGNNLKSKLGGEVTDDADVFDKVVDSYS